MLTIAKIAYRNLLRYTRRTFLTTVLVAVGIVAVLVFVGVAGSFKLLMVGQITDSMLGHLQIHRQGYVTSIDNSPLHLNLNQNQLQKLTSLLDSRQDVASYSLRLKLGGMLSNFVETTGIRLNGVDPDRELQTVPLLAQRISKDPATGRIASLKPGEVWLPESLANGMKIQPGAQVVIVATNREGSVNALPLVVSGLVGSMTGPGGRDGYLHINDAASLLRTRENEINEIAVRLQDFNSLGKTYRDLANELEAFKNQQNKPVFEIHTWEQLSPFANIASIIDLLTLFVKAILIAIVLVSVMNVMLMAVYERIREIGTIAAIGTSPARIRALFLMEGLFLGIVGAVSGSILGLIIIRFLHWYKIGFAFGRQEKLILEPTVAFSEVAITAGIVILISALAGLQPAIKASRLEPVDALRHY
jgi:putative ABC transport system permease protein